MFNYPVLHGYSLQCKPSLIIVNDNHVNGEKVVRTVSGHDNEWFTAFLLSLVNSAAGAVNGQVRIYNNASSLLYTFDLHLTTAGTLNIVLPLSPPLQLDEGDTIRIYSSSANLTVYITTYGYYE